MPDHYRVTYEDVVGAHEAALENGGGVRGIKSRDDILSAIGRPYTEFSGLTPYPTVASKAACLLHSIATSHGFTDANKRTAWIVCNSFLYAENCILWHPDEPYWYDVMATLVEDKWTVAQVLDWIGPLIEAYGSEQDVIAAYEDG
ncbi:Fic family protein [Actibacterium sp. 188UL27-1]|uniref:type II toxin-antitoxin system death-on-curing family toxin n=1 Tax=Actibacterium sp. 188UL27-1 TaxID=2786961 RepID=UPI0019592001|nr:Fic family protein [Actibacterium sp. 188UL27-1]